MKNKITLHLAAVGSLVSAGFHRLTSPDTLALGNAAENPPAPPSSAEKKLAQIASDEKEIQKMVEAGLDHHQAVAALKHKRDFAARDEEVTAAAAKAAKK